MRAFALPQTAHKRSLSFCGKRRYRDEARAREVVANARFHQRRIAREQALYGYGDAAVARVVRRECRIYYCIACSGWHTTSRA